MAKKTRRTTTAVERVWIPVPDEPFLDPMDEPWTFTRGRNGPEELDLPGVLLMTVRYMPMPRGTTLDSEMALDALMVLKAAQEQRGGGIELRKDVYDWMLSAFKENAHHLWPKPDAAFLCKWLKDNVSASGPNGAKP